MKPYLHPKSEWNLRFGQESGNVARSTKDAGFLYSKVPVGEKGDLKTFAESDLSQNFWDLLGAPSHKDYLLHPGQLSALMIKFK